MKKTVGTNVTYFVYADEGLVAEANESGTITTTYGFNPGSLWMNSPLFQRTFTGGTNSIFFLTDHLGAPQRALNSSGMEAWGIVQEAFGRAETLSGSSVDSNLRFSSQYLDSESGLHWNTMRYYQSGVGRYSRRDPILEAPLQDYSMQSQILRSRKTGQQEKQYVFVENGPDGRLDPLGLRLYDGRCLKIAFATPLGLSVTHISCHMTSLRPVYNCKHERCEVDAWFIGYSMGAPLSIVDFVGVFENPGTCVDFNGAAWVRGIDSMVGTDAVGFDASIGTLKLGQGYTWMSPDDTFLAGWDMSVGGAVGLSWVTSIYYDEGFVPVRPYD